MNEFLHRVANMRTRPLFYTCLAIYLLLDLAIMHGPLSRRFTRQETEQEVGIKHGWAALVNGQEPITKAQLNLAMDVYMARRGLHRDRMSNKNLSIVQVIAMDNLINDALLRISAKGQPVETPVAYIEKRIAEFKGHFSPGRLKEICDLHKLSEAGLHELLDAQFRQEFWLEFHFRDRQKEVTEKLVQEYYEGYKKHLISPETLRARHIFLATLEKDPAEREALIRRIHQGLTAGQGTFEELAAKHSEDLRTKNAGGDLGYFSRNRMPADFCAPVFALKPNEISAPFQTKLGWHIVQLTERRPERPLEYAEVRDEIRAHAENDLRREAVDEFVHKVLRNERRAYVTFFPSAKELDQP